MISIVIPIMNRTEFLARLLEYYVNADFDGCLCIGDSSTGQYLLDNKRLIESYREKLTIKYLECPDMDLSECTKAVSEIVETPYVAWVADDDFLIPRTLKKCADFLESNLDYSMARGRVVKLTVDANEPHGEIGYCQYYKLPEVVGENNVEKYYTYMMTRGDIIFFALVRTEVFRLAFKYVHLFGDRVFTAELLPNSLGVLSGKFKYIDDLHLVRQMTKGNFKPEQGEIINWLKRDDWYASLEKFHSIISPVISESMGLTAEQTEEILQHGFRIYLQHRVTREIKKKSPALGRSELTRHIKGITYEPGVVPSSGLLSLVEKIYIYISSRKKNRENTIAKTELLSSLLKNSHPYHRDFMPVYEAISQKKESLLSVS